MAEDWDRVEMSFGFEATIQTIMNERAKMWITSVMRSGFGIWTAM